MNSIFARGKNRVGAVFNSLDFCASGTPDPETFRPELHGPKHGKVVRPVLKPPQKLSVSFSELYCHQANIPVRRYAEAMFWDCMPRRGLLFAPVLCVLFREMFDLDYALIEFIGEMSTVEAIRSEAERHPVRGAVRTVFGLRISIKRLERIIERVVSKDRVTEANFRVGESQPLAARRLIADSAA